MCMKYLLRLIFFVCFASPACLFAMEMYVENGSEGSNGMETYVESNDDDSSDENTEEEPSIEEPSIETKRKQLEEIRKNNADFLYRIEKDWQEANDINNSENVEIGSELEEEIKIPEKPNTPNPPEPPINKTCNKIRLCFEGAGLLGGLAGALIFYKLKKGLADKSADVGDKAREYRVRSIRNYKIGMWVSLLLAVTSGSAMAIELAYQNLKK